MNHRKWFSSLGLRYFLIGILMMVVQIAVLAISAAIAPDLLTDYYLLIAMLPIYIVVVPISAWLISLMPKKHLRSYNLTAGQIFRTFCICIFLMFAGNLVGSAINSGIAGLLGTDGGSTVADVLGGSSIWQTFVVAVLAGPAVEEFLFRELLIDRLVMYGDRAAILISALAFGFYHGNVIQFVYAFLLGLVFGYIYIRTGKIIYTVILHMLVNFWGSVVSQLALGDGYVAAMEALENGMDPTVIAGRYAGPLIGFALFFLIYMIILVLGLIFLIRYVRKGRVVLLPGEYQLEPGSRFKTVVLNLGVILFIVYWIIMMITTIFS